MQLIILIFLRSQKLFEEAFPVSERPISMDDILANLGNSPCDILRENPDKFVGFFVGMNGEPGVCGVYYATDPQLRSTGIGTKAFKAILDYYKDKPFWFSYESTFQESDNAGSGSADADFI